MGPPSRSLPANGSASFYWDVEAPKVPPSGRISLTSTARGDGTGINFDDSTDSQPLVADTGLAVHLGRVGSNAVEIHRGFRLGTRLCSLPQSGWALKKNPWP